MNNNDNTPKAVNVIHFNSNSINLNNLCMPHTNFHQRQVSEAVIYGDMIVIRPAL